jgi:hypothetical protein
MHTALPAIVLVLSAATSAASVLQPESCEFRVVNWNAAGADSNWNAGNDIPVAQAVVTHVQLLDANVITLQEVTPVSLAYIEASLPGWDCESHPFPEDGVAGDIAVCVKGSVENFLATPLPDHGNTDQPRHWGYVQTEYQGALITSVHTRNFWDLQHLADLHTAVTTGILAGDFNHQFPENPACPDAPACALDPIWHQTDLDREITWQDAKIDHVLTIEAPHQVSGDAADKHGSNHSIVLATVTFPPQRPAIAVAVTNTRQPVEVDGDCAAYVEFRIAIHDNCCLDPHNLGLEVSASNPGGNATLGPVSLDSPSVVGPRDVEVTGRLAVSALESCPAEVVITASARDCAGNLGHAESQGTSASVPVVDSTPPEVTACDDNLYCLWPPNHEYVCFDAHQFAPVVKDNCSASPTWRFTSCTSNQPDNGHGDGNTINDCTVDADGQGFCARSERTGNGAGGRRYRLDVQAVDLCGNVSSPSTQIGAIHVPKDQRRKSMCIAPPH